MLNAPYYSFNDVNGDGFPDLFVGFYGSNGNHSSSFYLVLNNNGSLSPDGDNYLSNNAQTIISFNDYRVPYLADFNGDAITDLMLKSSTRKIDLVWRLGDTDSPLMSNIDDDITFSPQNDDIAASNTIKIADYNGDGRADILRENRIIHYIVKANDGNMMFNNYGGQISVDLASAVICNLNSDNKLDAVKRGYVSLEYDPDSYIDVVAQNRVV